MSDADKTSNKVEEIRGRAKEEVGRTTGDEELESQGKRDQAKSNVKQAGEKLKDAARDTTKR
ncbi:CsbD family protein [soil metagenome]